MEFADFCLDRATTGLGGLKCEMVKDDLVGVSEELDHGI